MKLTYDLPKTNGAWDRWLKDIAVDVWEPVTPSTRYESPHEYLEECAWFSTVTFDQWRMKKFKADLGLVEPDVSVEWDAFNLLYRQILERLLGSNFSRPKHQPQWPIALCAIDFEGSRLALGDELQPINPHLHSAWMFQPELASEAKRTLSGDVLSDWLKNYVPVDKVEFLPFDIQKLDRCGSYIMKAHDKASTKTTKLESARYYPCPPKSDLGLTHYRASRQYDVAAQVTGNNPAPVANIEPAFCATKFRRY